MTVLTWKDVATPDFRGTADGYEVAANLFGKSMGAIRGGLDDIKQDKVQGQSTALLAEIAQYQDDPAKLKAALPSILSKYDPKYLSSEALGTVMNRPAALLEQAGKQSAYNENQKGIKESDYIRDHADVFNGYLLAHRSGDPATIAKFEAEHSDVLKGASSGILKSFINNGQDITHGDLGTRGTLLGQTITQKNFDDGQSDRQVGILKDALKAELNNKALPGDHLRLLNTNRKDLEATYGARAVNALLNEYSGAAGPGVGGSAGGGAGGGGAGGGDIYNVVLGNGQYGTPPKPITTMTMGEVIDFGKNTLIPNSKAAGVGRDSRGLVGSSASGAYQITQETLQRYAPKVLGDNWQSQTFSAENQDKIAEAIFNDSKGGNLKAVWASLPNASPGAYAGKSWAEMRDIITQGESGGIANPRGLQVATDTANKADIAYSETGNIARTLNEAWQDKRSAREIANELVGEKGKYSGLDAGNMTQKINEIARQYKISPAVAARVLEEADNGNQSIFKRAFDGLPGTDGLPVDWDSDKIEQFAKIAQDRKGLADAAVTVDSKVQSIANSAQYSDQVKALTAARASKIMEAARRGIPADTSFEDAQLQVLTGTRDAALNTAADLAGRGNHRPVPPARVPVAKGPAKPLIGPTAPAVSQILAGATAKWATPDQNMLVVRK